MKTKTNLKRGILFLVIVLALSISAYALESRNMMEKGIAPGTDSMHAAIGEPTSADMNAAHQEMTKNLDPNIKQQMDEMHKMCTEQTKGGEKDEH